jgi:GR25 family glycosyltransferase involved in LPS biosynthesis
MATINIPVQRFNAIRVKNGAIGCSMSHVKCLETAKKMNLPHILICEDDIEFLDPSLFVEQLNSFFEKHQDDWDVVLFAGNNLPPYRIPENDNTCVQVSHCQTTTGYLVKSHYFDTLILNMKEGVTNLIAEPEKHTSYAIDKYWLSLQKQHKWFLIVPLTVVQKIDYSDIEKKMTNYKNGMVDLDKKYLFDVKFRGIPSHSQPHDQIQPQKRNASMKRNYL